MASNSTRSLRRTPTTRLLCFLSGHVWTRNGMPPLPVSDDQAEIPADWRTCLRCGRWELLS
jgi:hypothetical protein